MVLKHVRAAIGARFRPQRRNPAPMPSNESSRTLPDGRCVTGAVINNLPCFAEEGGREDVNQMLIQPFLNYNLSDG